ncbi:Astacin-like metalloprotease toxin 1-like precursor [Limulus polyphemus]|uniref:Metalloendopeptidase n=1 Tax=Limulus polyphemus TaxID=6850 RepID=B4F319_LIMPO|nr:Astacin-like metalloprotease toxin 1-like precursor [Limulus polyphemus]CAQ16892.1 astacin-like metalloprotease [Limulus polyphemus]
MKLMSITLLLTSAVAAHVIPLPKLALQNTDLFEGDILGIGSPEDRNAIPNDSQRWTEGAIPYVIDSSLSGLTQMIQQAMNQYHKYTCIRFKKRTTETHYVRMFKGQGCNSFVGNIHRGAQNLSLGYGCEYLGTVVHELGHAVGFWHEHTRSDRDDYLNIHWENIMNGMEIWFKKMSVFENRLLDTFDYDSIMLYGETSFSKDGRSRVMTAKDGTFLKEPYNKPGLSKSDILRINKLYECN